MSSTNGWRPGTGAAKAMGLVPNTQSAPPGATALGRVGQTTMPTMPWSAAWRAK